MFRKEEAPVICDGSQDPREWQRDLEGGEGILIVYGMLYCRLLSR